MKQRNGAELFGANDSRGASIGIIEVAPEDDRQSILTALLTQDKLERKQTVIVLPDQNEGLRNAGDFKDLEKALAGLHTQLIFVAPRSSSIARLARQRNYQVFATLENYAQYARTFLNETLATPDSQVTPVAEVTRNPTPARNKSSKEAPRRKDQVPSVPPTPSIPTPSPTPDQEQTRPLPNSAAKNPQAATRPTEEIPPAPTPAPTSSIPKAREEPQTIGNGTREQRQKQKNSIEPMPIVLGDPIEDEPTTPVVTTQAPDENNSQKHLLTPSVTVTPATQPAKPANTAPTSNRKQNLSQPVPETMAIQVPDKAPPGSLLPVPTITISTAELPTRPIKNGARALQQRKRWLAAALSALIIILIGAGVIGAWTGFIPVTRIFPGLASATITLTPISKPYKTTYTLKAAENPSANEVQLRYLPATMEEQTQTVSASGNGESPATQAQGLLTFYNRLDSTQNIPIGTVIASNSGISVITEQSAIVPAAMHTAGNDFQESSISVPAQALLPGNQGNIAAYTFSRVHCCAAGITVENSVAFSGGEDKQSYKYVQQSDINQAINTMSEPLQQKKQHELLSEVAANEKLIGSPQCITSTTSDHEAGEQAEQVTVRLDVTCAGVVYDVQEAQNLARQQFTSDGIKAFGANYTPAQTIMVQVNSARADGETGQTTLSNQATLQVQVSSVWTYQIEQAQMKQMIHLIAGKSEDTARTLLLRQNGVRNVSIILPWYAGGTLPANEQQITANLSAS